MKQYKSFIVDACDAINKDLAYFQEDEHGVLSVSLPGESKDIKIKIHDGIDPWLEWDLPDSIYTLSGPEGSYYIYKYLVKVHKEHGRVFVSIRQV